MKATKVNATNSAPLVRVVEVSSRWGKECREVVYARHWLGDVPLAEFNWGDFEGVTVPLHRTSYEIRLV